MFTTKIRKWDGVIVDIRYIKNGWYGVFNYITGYSKKTTDVPEEKYLDYFKATRHRRFFMFYGDFTKMVKNIKKIKQDLTCEKCDKLLYPLKNFDEWDEYYSWKRKQNEKGAQFKNINNDEPKNKKI